MYDITMLYLRFAMLYVRLRCEGDRVFAEKGHKLGLQQAYENRIIFLLRCNVCGKYLDANGNVQNCAGA